MPVELSLSAVQLHGCWHAVGVIRDIARRKQAALEYKTVLQTALDGYCAAAAAGGRFVEVNDAFCAMLGYSREELLGMSVRDIEAAEMPEEVAAHMHNIISTGYDRFETRHRRKDGEILEVEVSARYLDLRGGVICTFIRDILRTCICRELCRVAE